MLAVGLSIGLFAFWWSFGYGVLAVCSHDRDPLGRALLAPSVGLAATILAIFLPNMAGWPVGTYAMPLLAVLLVCCVALLTLFRPSLPPRTYLLFVFAFLAGLLLTAWPMLVYGFDWVPYANDDMANYVLAAQRLLHQGFYALPNLPALLAGRDYSLGTWFNWGAKSNRTGGEDLLAWLMAVTHMDGPSLFMPLVCASQLALISATAALIYHPQRRVRAAFIATILVAGSALITVGSLYQLLPQVIGLALLTGLVSLLTAAPQRFSAISRATPPGVLVGAALFVTYPELLPFLAVTLAIFWVRLLTTNPRKAALVGVGSGITAVTASLLLNRYFVSALSFLTSKLNDGAEPAFRQPSPFPYYLKPVGLAYLWGLQSMQRLSNEPWLSVSIALGALLLAICAVGAIRLTWSGAPVAIMALTMIAVGATFFRGRADFGLFKLAMYAQPFLLGTFALMIDTPRRAAPVEPRKRAIFRGRIPARVISRLAPALSLLLPVIAVQQNYVKTATGSGSLLYEASASRIVSQIDRTLMPAGGDIFEVDTANPVLTKLEFAHLRGRQAFAVSTDYTRGFTCFAGDRTGLLNFAQNFCGAAQATAGKPPILNFDLHNSESAELKFVPSGLQPPDVPAGPTRLITANGFDIFNGSSTPGDAGQRIQVQPWNQVSNRLIFVNSNLGQYYYEANVGEGGPVSVYQLQPDPLIPGHGMEALGRYLLFEVANPSPTLRLSFSLSNTIKGDGQNVLPPAAVVGESREPFAFVGGGSARLFSPPIKPQVIDGRAYVAVDLGTDGQPFPTSDTGLTGLYGSDVTLDSRRLVAFGRDISAYSPDEYESLSQPTAIQSFPQDLENAYLAYSGIYESGWLSKDASVELRSEQAASELVIRGVVPKIDDPNFKTELTVLLDGKEVDRREIGVGSFEVAPAGAQVAGPHRVELRFSNLQRFRPPDPHSVAAMLTFAGFEASAGAPAQPTTDIVDPATNLALGTGWYPLETYTGETFRWVDNDAEIDQPRGSSGGQLLMDVEPGPGVKEKPAQMHLTDTDTGVEVGSVDLAGRQPLTFSLPAATNVGRRYKLHIDNGGNPTAGDSRILNFRVFSIRLTDSMPLPKTAEISLQNGITLGSGWYPLETYADETFHWVDNDAQINLRAGSTGRVALEVAPGPGLSALPALIHLRDRQTGQEVGAASMMGRQTIGFEIPASASGSRGFMLHVDGGGKTIPSDPRILNFRVFSIAWVAQSDGRVSGLLDSR